MSEIRISDSERFDSRISAETLVRLGQHEQRRITISFDYPPIPWRGADWSATDSNTYDGAPDSGNSHQVGRGPTAEAALIALLDILEEDAEERAA